MLHRLVSQLTVVAKISALMPPAMRTRNTSRTRKRLKRTLKRKATVIVRRQTRLCCGLQRSGLCLPLEISLRCNVVSNVAAFCHCFLQTRKLKRGMTQTSAAIHLLDPTTLQTLKPLLPTQPALREIQVMMVRWSLQADELGWLSSMSSRVGKERSSKKGMRSKGAEGPASNISFNGNSPGWTVLISPRQNCCKAGGGRRRRNKGVEPRALRDGLPLHFLLAYKTYVQGCVTSKYLWQIVYFHVFIQLVFHPRRL